MSVRALYDTNADVVIPAFDTDQITRENVEQLVGPTNGDPKPRIIVEAANGPMTTKAYEWLCQHHPEIIVIADVLANAGGVTVSFFEWIRNYEAVIQTRQIRWNPLWGLMTYFKPELSWVKNLAEVEKLGPKPMQEIVPLLTGLILRSLRSLSALVLPPSCDKKIYFFC